MKERNMRNKQKRESKHGWKKVGEQGKKKQKHRGNMWALRDMWGNSYQRISTSYFGVCPKTIQIRNIDKYIYRVSKVNTTANKLEKDNAIHQSRTKETLKTKDKALYWGV